MEGENMDGVAYRREGNGYFQTTKELVDYYNKIEVSKEAAPSNGVELAAVFDKIEEMDKKYRIYLKTHCCFVRFLLTLCFWRSSVHGAYMYSCRILINRVSEGYKDKAVSLYVMKKFLKNPISRSFCRKIFKTVYQQTKNAKNMKGFIWKIVSPKGVNHFLIGTSHRGTKHMLKIRGIEQAMNQAEEFFTELGANMDWLPSGNIPWWKLKRISGLRVPMDTYITAIAHKRKKAILALDTSKIRTVSKMREAQFNAANNAKGIKPLTGGVVNIQQEHLPSKKYFLSTSDAKELFDLEQQDPNRKCWILAQQIQLINLWQKGDVALLQGLYGRKISSDERTKTWLKHAFSSYESHDPLPGLYERIANSEKSICIAVGAYHCMGNAESKVSLIDAFQKMGCKVSRL